MSELQLLNSVAALGSKSDAAAYAVRELLLPMALLVCRTNRQRRKVAHKMLCNARKIERSFDNNGSRQDSAFDQARYRATSLRKNAELVASFWKGLEIQINWVHL